MLLFTAPTAVPSSPSEKNTPVVIAYESREPIVPVALRPVSVIHAPAFASPVSVQFRKDCWLFQKSSFDRRLWAYKKFFRNWAPGADTTAGTWLADTGRNATGVVGALDSDVLPSGVFFTDGRGLTAVSSGDRSIVKMDLSKQWKGHVGTEFSPEHIWQPAILYLGRPAQV